MKGEEGNGLSYLYQCELTQFNIVKWEPQVDGWG